MGKFYSSIEKDTVRGIELLSSVLWINSRLYFPLFTDMADVKSETDDEKDFHTSTDKFISIIEKINLQTISFEFIFFHTSTSSFEYFPSVI